MTKATPSTGQPPKPKKSRKSRCEKSGCRKRILHINEGRLRCSKCGKLYCAKHAIALTTNVVHGHDCAGLMAHAEEWKAKLLQTKTVAAKLCPV